MKNIRIVLVDDHEVVRTGLKAYLNTQSGIEVIGEAGDGLEAVNMARDLNPDLIVMDISMPGMDGMQATQRIRSVCPACKVLALTVHADRQYFLEMLSAGAMGYVSKQAAADELLNAIRVVAVGEVYFQPAFTIWLLEEYRRLLDQGRGSKDGEVEKHNNHDGLSVLTDREIQVLRLVAESQSNSEIGDVLGISPKTVARHRERIMNKLNIHSIVELVRFAISSGLVDLK